MRIALVFLVAAFTGLLIQATLVHSSFPAAMAPDFILILTVAISLFYHSAWGALSSFALGLLADFASAEYLGPNAAGCVLAFCLVGLIANRVYADKGIAVGIIAFVCSLAKSATVFCVLYFYVDEFVFSQSLFHSMMWEAFLSALLAPLVLRLLRKRVVASSSMSKTQTAPAFRWSS
jgi:rod shape-determining protein MreD